MSDAGTARASNDVVWILRVLARFDPRATRQLVLIGVTSFVMGLTEAATLVLITSSAVTTAQDGSDVTAGPITLGRDEVLLVALALLVVSAVMSYVVGRIIARVSADSALVARQQLLDSFHEASYQRKSQDRVAGLQEALTTYVDRFTAAFSAVSMLLSAVLSTLSFAVAALIVSPAAAVALTLIGSLLVLVVRPATARTRRAANVLATRRRDYAKGATESVLLARELSVFGMTAVAGRRLRDLDAGVAEQFRITRLLAFLTPRLYQYLALGYCQVLGSGVPAAAVQCPCYLVQAADMQWP